MFELDLQSGEAELLPGRRTETWGVNGAYLGPTLRASRGERVLVRARNELSAATTLHRHGMHLPAWADGGLHQVIRPGATWAPGWRIDQPAATLWYHPHLHRQTAEHVYRGIAGLFIIDDPAARRLSLPHDYGVDDIPLIIQDKRFDGDGSLDFSYRLISLTGFLGDTLLVNGSFDPHLNVSSEHVRFRLLNASNARVYNLGFSDNRRFHLIASDAGLLQRPHPTTRLQLSLGERAEIVARFASSERVVLRSTEPELGATSGRSALPVATTASMCSRSAPRACSRRPHTCRPASLAFSWRASETPSGCAASSSPGPATSTPARWISGASTRW